MNTITFPGFPHTCPLQAYTQLISQLKAYTAHISIEGYIVSQLKAYTYCISIEGLHSSSYCISIEGLHILYLNLRPTHLIYLLQAYTILFPN